ncbi:Hypothetical protein PHPALM_3193 [Phytophthora palmivora]|uniref:Uncharacterized protein n=1 Tax=Phytophthora palmivora TaxID=4796 RepID=A0A2P4YN11_9STRA|nr:Hypothetical protein PHPALM_3193 [Phytophthora palmivora]
MTLGPAGAAYASTARRSRCQANGGCCNVDFGIGVECEARIVLPGGVEPEQQNAAKLTKTVPTEDRDMGMESVESLDRHPTPRKYNPEI